MSVLLSFQLTNKRYINIKIIHIFIMEITKFHVIAALFVYKIKTIKLLKVKSLKIRVIVKFQMQKMVNAQF
jgi:hypothetical protein